MVKKTQEKNTLQPCYWCCIVCHCSFPVGSTFETQWQAASDPSWSKQSQAEPEESTWAIHLLCLKTILNFIIILSETVSADISDF